jgi:hypothetical protein
LGGASTLVVLNLALFILIALIILNVITAILLDNFTKLRQEREDYNRRMKTFCVVCGLDHAYCDMHSAKMKDGKDFKYHKQQAHNLDHYCFFLFHLKMKSKDDYNGIESFVQKCIENDEYGRWMPRMMCYDMQSDGDTSREVEKKPMGVGGGGVGLAKEKNEGGNSGGGDRGSFGGSGGGEEAATAAAAAAGVESGGVEVGAAFASEQELNELAANQSRAQGAQQKDVTTTLSVNRIAKKMRKKPAA